MFFAKNDGIYRRGFSIIELVFVIVILGILATVAVPKFIATRADAEVTVLKADISTILKVIPSVVFANNIDITGNEIPSVDGIRRATWAEWMIDVSGLDRSRWYASSAFGISPKNRTEECLDIRMELVQQARVLRFSYPEPTLNPKGFCETLRASLGSRAQRNVSVTK